jgi:hypothetical protein
MLDVLEGLFDFYFVRPARRGSGAIWDATGRERAPDQCSCSWRRAGMVVNLAALSRMSTLAAFPGWKGER